MYTEIRVNTIDKLTHCLNNPVEEILMKVFSEREAKKYSNAMFFRGQENADFKLLPSYFRESRFFENKSDEWYSKYNSEKIVGNEFSRLKKLCIMPDFCEKHKINEEIFDENYFNNKFKNALPLWPSDEYCNALELAQHHNKDGFYTSLLDWTSNQYIAAYFAVQPYILKAEESKKYKDLGKEFAIWCYCHDEDDKKYGIRFMKAPIKYDKNMTAQDGHFSLVEQDMRYGHTFKVKTLEDVVQKERLFKITAPLSIAYSLMKYCDEEKKINGSRVYWAEGVSSESMYIKEMEIWKMHLGIEPYNDPFRF